MKKELYRIGKIGWNSYFKVEDTYSMVMPSDVKRKKSVKGPSLLGLINK